MYPSPLTILAVFAHPDDEIGVGSTLAHYGDQGAFTVLACASRGEAATIYCDECATRENLADVRTHELECACRHLGITQLRWLDWPDGGIADLPREAAVRQIVALIREVRPDVIITHPEHGLYPHPDHLAVWEITRAAFDAAADAESFPKVGQPWAAARLYTRAIPQSYFDASPEFAAYRVELNGERLPFHPTADEDVDVTMRVADHAYRRLAAWDCHRSQHNPNGPFTQMPDQLRRQMAEEEYFVLEAYRAPLPEFAADLAAGLGAAPIGAPAGDIEPEESPEAAALLRLTLATARALLSAIEQYEKRTQKEPVKALLQPLLDGQQEIIYLLAGAVRRAGENSSAVEPDARLLAQAHSCVDDDSQLRFVRAAALSAVQWYEAEASARAGAGGGRAAEWGELAAIGKRQLERLAH